MKHVFDHIVGNNQVKQYLSRMAAKNEIANSLLFAGPEGVGKSLFAEAFARLILCADDSEGTHLRKLSSGTHPDLRIYRPEGKIGMHTIDSMRQFSEEVYLAPYEASRKIFIIHDADRMLSYSANALLKTFEEPAAKSIIILLSHNPEALLPTVLSRCCTIRFHALSQAEILQLLKDKGKSDQEAASIAALSRGSIGNAIRLIEKGGDQLRQRVLDLLTKGKLSTYGQVMENAKEISAIVEQAQKETEGALRTSYSAFYPDGMTSAQQNAVEKEIDGAIALYLAREAHTIFDIILSWYRDMHLLQVNGNSAFLIHPDFRDSIEQASQRGEVLSIESVQQAIAQARLALERSTPLINCLENLLLKLSI